VKNKRSWLQDKKRSCEPTYDVFYSDLYQDFSECGVEIVRPSTR
jgi:hypothetical protein